MVGGGGSWGEKGLSWGTRAPMRLGRPMNSKNLGILKIANYRGFEFRAAVL